MKMTSMGQDLQELYRTRFSDNAEKSKNAVWAEICNYFTKNVDMTVFENGRGGAN